MVSGDPLNILLMLHSFAYLHSDVAVGNDTCQSPSPSFFVWLVFFYFFTSEYITKS